MTETGNETIDVDDDNTPFEDVRNAAKNEARLRKEAEANFQRAERELFLARQLPGLNEAQSRALMAAHDGEWDAEAVKATAVELGFTQPDAPQGTPEPAGEEREGNQAEQRMDALNAASAGAPPAEPNPDDRLQAAFDKAQKVADPSRFPELEAEVDAAIAAHPNYVFGEVGIDPEGEAKFSVPQTTPKA